ncbi:UDP-N-acetylmuramoyl-L-alanine--D-glutamate ligase [Clostridium cadaveris]|uniref:UDP-N-acetylmuramoyl-L-alanine--D-glutamate ligase n=1 Tax=Clostridium cadaveris TaxID=1529 RepID=UPI001E2DE606|nr:UDP-N-acetylmuramoyl-L-alanine--D-glutamate ligase [Clostridium cadaveris]UFH64715.1 UDP-N-acetylmuramoyl-L-alanine--D-glutamate ligase [Clostridium cadaveris]
MKRDFREFKDFIKGSKVAVVGIGISNLPLINFLVKLGADVTAFDRKDERDLGATSDNLKSIGVKLCLGQRYLDGLTGFEVIFKTPGMRIDSPALVKAKEEGAKITSEMEEFLKYCPAKVYGVTGSDGKTTTTTIISKLLTAEGYKTWVGGNIGAPLFANIEDIKPENKVVLELSSFQLMTMDVSPEVAIITNLSPNHLDMHKNMNEYIESKKNIFKYQDKNSLLILNRENDITYSFIKEAKGNVELFSNTRVLEDGAFLKNDMLFIKGTEVCSKNDIRIKGDHNVQNYLAAFLAVKDDVSKETMKNVAMNFNGVEHRNEFIREVEGVKYYNDSIGSSPTRTLATISVFEEPVILLAGGYDKKIPFETLAQNGYSHIKTLILMGHTKEKIKKVFDDLRNEKGINIPIYIVENLEEALLKAKEISKSGDSVVLSPACASFDAFPNFEVRGNRFKELVNKL